MTDEIRVCPACDSSRINRRTGGVRYRPPSDDRAYHCENCGETFDTPTERERRSSKAGFGLARRLELMEL